MRSIKVTLRTIFFAIPALSAAHAQTAAPPTPTPAAPAQNSQQQTISLINNATNSAYVYNFDYGVPSSPAIALAGTASDQTSDSSSLKPYTLSVPAIYGGAKTAQSFAGDIAPALLLLPGPTNNSNLSDPWINTTENYENNSLLRVVDRTRFGTAIYLGSKATSSTTAINSRLAFGISTSLLSGSDPLATTLPSGKPVWSDCNDNVISSPAEAAYVAAHASLQDLENSLAPTESVVLQLAGDASANASLSIAEFPGVVATVNNCLGTGGPCSNLSSASDQLKTQLGLTQQAYSTLSAAINAHDVAKQQLAEKAVVTAAEDLWLAMQNVSSSISANETTQSAKLSSAGAVIKALNQCVSKANAYARFGDDLALGLGTVWTGQPGTLSGLHELAEVVWASARIGLFPSTFDPTVPNDQLAYWMLGISARYSRNEIVATGNKATPNIAANVTDTWAGLEHYSASWSLAARAGYIDTEASQSAERTFSKSGTRWLVSASLKLDNAISQLLPMILQSENASAQPTNGAWINISYGSSQGTVTTLDNKTLLVSLSFSPTPANLFNEIAKSGS